MPHTGKSSQTEIAYLVGACVMPMETLLASLPTFTCEFTCSWLRLQLQLQLRLWLRCCVLTDTRGVIVAA